MTEIRIGDARLCLGECLEVLRTLPAASVQCCVTSPPYWGLRDYGVEGQLGLEPMPDLYVAHLVEVFREVRRVLRDDGTLWLNLGDSYFGDSPTRKRGSEAFSQTWDPAQTRSRGGLRRSAARCGVLKPKDLVGIPWRVAFALQADGWWLRQDIIWAKPNPMPESITDRCTKAHEYIFLLTKSERYYYDAEAVKEPAEKRDKARPFGKSGNADRRDGAETFIYSPTRNRRSVWTITPKPFAEAHFATFPPELPEVCIRAGTSEKGCCPTCGTPWVRVLLREGDTRTEAKGKAAAADPLKVAARRICERRDALRAQGRDHDNPIPPSKALGWQPGCACGGEPVPCTVLDPFSGAGTTALVARSLGRRSLGIELNPAYHRIAERRLAKALHPATYAPGDGQAEPLPLLDLAPAGPLTPLEISAREVPSPFAASESEPPQALIPPEDTRETGRFSRGGQSDLESDETRTITGPKGQEEAS